VFGPHSGPSTPAPIDAAAMLGRSCARCASIMSVSHVPAMHVNPCCESSNASLQPVISAAVHSVTSMQDAWPRPPCILTGSMHVLMVINATRLASRVA
jgi:hypothetical protein